MFNLLEQGKYLIHDYLYSFVLGSRYLFYIFILSLILQLIVIYSLIYFVFKLKIKHLVKGRLTN